MFHLLFHLILHYRQGNLKPSTLHLVSSQTLGRGPSWHKDRSGRAGCGRLDPPPLSWQVVSSDLGLGTFLVPNTTLLLPSLGRLKRQRITKTETLSSPCVCEALLFKFVTLKLIHRGLEVRGTPHLLSNSANLQAQLDLYKHPQARQPQPMNHVLKVPQAISRPTTLKPYGTINSKLSSCDLSFRLGRQSSHSGDVPHVMVTARDTLAFEDRGIQK